MNKAMPIGVDDFKKVREDYYFVDKTDFIRQLIDTHSAVTLITRPRRFGKTLTLSMLEYFFSIDRKKESQGLFSGLSLEKSGTAYMNHLGAHPVIFLSLKNVSGDTWESIVKSLGFALADLYRSFNYLAQSADVDDSLKIYLQKVIYEKATQDELAVSLLRLTTMLHQHYGKPVILLIDEYDAPIQQAWEQGFYEECIRFMRQFLGSALKTNASLDFAVLTGVLRIAKESIFSGLNNLDVCSVMTDQYSDVFGFTADEVSDIASALQCSHMLPDIQAWYDGYRFGKADIYNPWSVINFFDKQTLADYWVNTSGNAILRQLMKQTDAEQKESLLSLLQGDSVTAVIREGVIYDDIGENPDALYTMLLTTGYLTAIHKQSTFGGQLCRLVIPNREVKDAYRAEVLERMRGRLAASSLLLMMEDLVAGHVVPFSKTLERYIACLVSSYDAANKESFYHGFLLGMTALFVPEYVVESNRESGYGRFDIAIFPKDTSKAGVLMEFKAADSEAQLEDKADEALRQIEEKQYSAEFEKRGISKVWKYGIAFCGKQVHVKMKI